MKRHWQPCEGYRMRPQFQLDQYCLQRKAGETTGAQLVERRFLTATIACSGSRQQRGCDSKTHHESFHGEGEWLCFTVTQQNFSMAFQSLGWRQL